MQARALANPFHRLKLSVRLARRVPRQLKPKARLELLVKQVAEANFVHCLLQDHARRPQLVLLREVPHSLGRGLKAVRDLLLLVRAPRLASLAVQVLPSVHRSRPHRHHQ